MRITIESQNYKASIETLGAELKSFQNPEGKEFIWTGDPEFWIRSSPTLFPSIGNVRNGKTWFYGKEYEMPKHGFCKETEFEVSEKTEDMVRFSITANDTTRQCYPFDFQFSMTYRIHGNKLSITYEVCNCDTKEMYYHIGTHPGFLCPLEEGEIFQDYEMVFEKDERLEAVPYDLENLCFDSKKTNLFTECGKTFALKPELFENDAIYFPHTNSRRVSLLNPKTEKGIQVDYPGFRSTAFWTVARPDTPYVCIENWNGAAIYDDEDNEFCHKRDVETLAANANASYELEITLLGY